MLCKQHAMFYTNYCCKYFPCLWSVFQDMKRDVKWVSKLGIEVVIQIPITLFKHDSLREETSLQNAHFRGRGQRTEIVNKRGPIFSIYTIFFSFFSQNHHFGNPDGPPTALSFSGSGIESFTIQFNSNVLK